MLRIALRLVYRGLPTVVRCHTSRFHTTSKTLQLEGVEGTRGRKRAGKILYFLGTVTLASGATVAYAKYDPEFRKWLTENVPYSDEAIKVILEDDNSLYASLSTYFGEMKSQVWEMIFRKEDKPSVTKPQRKEVHEDIIEKKTYKTPANVLSSLLNTPEPESANVGVSLPESSSPSSRTEPESTEPPSIMENETFPIADANDLVELEKNVANTSKLAIDAYREAACACKEYGQDIEHLLEESVESLDSKIWPRLKSRIEKKEKSLELAQAKSKTAMESVEKLKSYLEGSHVPLPEALKENTKQNLERVQEEVAIAMKNTELECKKSVVTERCWNKVEEARRHFAEQLEILIPSFKITDKTLKIAESDLDLFVLHAFRTIVYYQKELQKLEAISEQRLQKAIEESGGDVEKAIIFAEVEAQLEIEARRLEVEFQKKALALKAEAERELRLQLKRQAEAHSDHLRDALAICEAELSRKFQREADEKIAEEQEKYKLQLASMMGRLKGLETALRARAEADKKAAQAQLLWSAAQSLHSCLKAGTPGVPWIEQLRPLEAEVVALQKASVEGDELVEVVVAGIPREAVSRGVYPENALRERFLKVERVAKRLALVPENGGSLPMYLLSYLQSLFLINAVNPIPQAELADEPIDLTNLDTFDVLQRARYWLDRGNFTQTLRYMNLLKGASRKVASDWINETRILLETQQAAGTLLAHAAAAGLVHL